MPLFTAPLVHRLLGLAVLALLGTLPAGAQTFVAPTSNNVIATSEVSGSEIPSYLLYVTNRSTVPIIVFGLTLSDCENIRQSCGGRNLNIKIEPSERRQVGRIDIRSNDRASNYRWRFAWRADSSDARLIAAMRDAGMLEDQARVIAGEPRPVAASPAPAAVADSTPIEQPLSREPLTDEERGLGSRPRPAGDAVEQPLAFRFKVFYGSVLGSTMMPGAPVQVTGPCVNPAESAKYEKDGTITRTPWRPPVVTGFVSAALPAALRDSTLKGGDVLVRWVADTSGATLPGSVNILESPHGLLSVRVCTSVIGARVTPARDKAGRPIRSWVQIPVKVTR
jgi:hypothetical protein